VRLCIFDLDHTLVRSSLDLAAMALDMRALLESRCGPLPPRPDRYRVGELIAYCQQHAPVLEPDLWTVALEHERRALGDASLEPGAREAVAGAQAAGFATALWTNNTRDVTCEALGRFGLDRELHLIVTRDDMRALKPDPDGWRVIAEHFGLANGRRATACYVVGDSWVDGVAATAAGIPFIAYRANPGDLERWNVAPVAHLSDLAELPRWLGASGHGT
jgi:beta-phosphoglucomutase-like phosphatase (HAD superfamily)